MIDAIMWSSIGFLAAGLLMAALAPLIHGRAVRLTVQRLLRGLPRSMVEMRAQKDQLRAEHAVSTRRLEMTVADMQSKTAGHLVEAARKAAEIDRLKTELRKANLTILRFQGRELMRRSTIRTVVRLVIYLYERSRRVGRKLGLGLPLLHSPSKTGVNALVAERVGVRGLRPIQRTSASRAA
jgi:hypothetical protein